MTQLNSELSQIASLEDSLWQDACLVIEMIALMVSGGISQNPPTLLIKAHAGPVREAFMQRLEDVVSRAVFHKMPVGIDEQRLIGGLDLSATLSSGKRVASKGLLAECDNQMLVIPMANIIEDDVIAQVTAAIDNGHVKVEREGMSATDITQFGLVVFDESDEDEQPLSETLKDRIVFHLDLSTISYRVLNHDFEMKFPDVANTAFCDSKTLEEICSVALSFGLTSIRPTQQVVRVAILNARLHGRTKVIQDDVVTAIRLSLLNRAKQLPQAPQSPEEMEEEAQNTEPEASENPPDAPDENHCESDNNTKNLDEPLEDLNIESLASQLPDGLLEQLSSSLKLKSKTSSQGRKGKQKYGSKRGKPVASKRGELRSGKSLDVMATLRAAAPWQKIRAADSGRGEAIHVRPQDFHIRRYKQNTETSTIFLVDASGSTALNRLGEAKGAVESLLAEGYARRDHVGLIAFRKRQAETLLSPTRSLVRAKKSLASLPGGGGTPLASGLQMAYLMASEEIKKGRATSLVIMTDGSANVALDGTGGRAKAMEDALSVCNLFVGAGLSCLVIDVSRLPNPKAKTLSEKLAANYIPMPFVSSRNLSDAVKASR